MGFLLDERYWGHGYTTEPAAAVVRLGFQALKLNRICARHLASNAASARVLAKVGMQRAGMLREFARKPKGFEDVVVKRTGLWLNDFREALPVAVSDSDNHGAKAALAGPSPPRADTSVVPRSLAVLAGNAQVADDLLNAQVHNDSFGGGRPPLALAPSCFESLDLT